MSDSINDLAETLYNARKSQERYGWREWSGLDERARKKWESAVEAVISLIRAQERERCADLIKDMRENSGSLWHEPLHNAEICLRSIRALKE